AGQGSSGVSCIDHIQPVFLPLVSQCSGGGVDAQTQGGTCYDCNVRWRGENRWRIALGGCSVGGLDYGYDREKETFAFCCHIWVLLAVFLFWAPARLGLPAEAVHPFQKNPRATVAGNISKLSATASGIS